MIFSLLRITCRCAFFIFVLMKLVMKGAGFFSRSFDLESAEIVNSFLLYIHDYIGGSSSSMLIVSSMVNAKVRY